MTTYVAPKVFVYQEYATQSVSASDADFIPIVIGPCYHVIDENTDEDLAYLMEYDDSGIVDAYFPSPKTGSVVDPDSVRIRFKDCRTLYASNFACASISANGNVLNFSDIVAGDFEVGDYVTIKNSSSHAVLFADKQVIAVDVINNTVTLNYACSTLVATLEVDVYRPITDFSLIRNADGNYTAIDVNGDAVSYTGGVVTVDVADSKLNMTPIYIILSSVARKSVYAKVYVGYVARMTSLNRITEFTTSDTAIETIGKADIRNPMGMAVGLIFANMSKVPVKTFATVDDTLDSWNEAKDAISVDPNVYTIVPLTQDAAVLAIFKDHAVSMSDPETGQFRICVGSAALELDSEVERGHLVAEGTGVISNNDDTILCILTDDTAQFITDGVAVGDKIRLYDSNQLPSLFTVSDVLGANRIKADPQFPFEVNGGQDVTIVKYVSIGGNDGYVQNDNLSMHTTSTTLIAGNPAAEGGVSDAFVLFNDVTVGPDVTTTSAYISMKAAADMAHEVDLRIYGVLGASNIDVPVDKTEYAALTLTTAYVTWTLTSLTKDTVYTTPTIKTIIDEMVAANPWERGGNMLFVIKDHSSTDEYYATFYAYDTDGGANKPALQVTFPPGEFVATNSYSYEVIHQYTIGELAAAYAAISTSLSTTTRANMVNIYPTSCYITGITEEQPGYYLAAAVAGRCGDTPGHQSLTRSSVSGISKLGDLGLFSNSQLDTIAAGGTFIFTQANQSAVPVIRHQLTTNMASIEFRELSFVRNFDYVSMILKGVLEQYIGKYNITPTNLSILGNAINGTLKALSLASQPVIGAPVLSYKLVSLAQLEDQRDRVEAYIDVLFPYPMNYIGLHIVSQ